MGFQDNSNSVQSLLALLRSTQDGPSTVPSANNVPGSSSRLQPPPGVSTNRTLSRHGSGQPAHDTGGSGTNAGPAVPSQQQLNDLLRSLNNNQPQAGSSATASPAGPVETSSRLSRTLIQPFGPVATAVPISPTGSRRVSQDQTRRVSAVPAEGAEIQAGGDLTRGGEASRLSFAKCLPRLTELMGDEGFLAELRSMKADQDALERRLWAKQEKIKADHDRTLQAERDIARISQRPIPAAKTAQWAADLELNLQDFQRQTCLPALDSQSGRHRARLLELGVPGLGGLPAEEDGTVERWRRIMDLLQAGLEE